MDEGIAELEPEMTDLSSQAIEKVEVEVDMTNMPDLVGPMCLIHVLTYFSDMDLINF
jgi:hypothetical protein